MAIEQTLAALQTRWESDGVNQLVSICQRWLKIRMNIPRIDYGVHPQGSGLFEQLDDMLCGMLAGCRCAIQVGRHDRNDADDKNIRMYFF